MTRSLCTTFLAAAFVAVSLAAACGGHTGQFDGDDGGGGGGTSGGGTGSSGGSGGGSSGIISLGGSSSSGSGSTSGGTTTGCDASCGAAGGTCNGATCTLSENPGGVATATQSALQAKGSADSAFTWLYPYDKTVFPKGLVSPTLQFGGGASDAEYVHITSKTLDYKGYFAGGAANAVTLSLSQKAWVAVTAAVGLGDSANVSVTKISGGSVSGPITESWPIAQGNIRGTIYYETYDSSIIGGIDGGLGSLLSEATGIGIMKIQPGATQPTPLKSGCGNVCHTASSDGSTLVAATTTASSASYDLKNGGAAYTSLASTLFTYGALYPDGSFLMSSTGFRLSGNMTSRLYDTKTATNIPAPGWDSVITAGGTPAFSPDGKQIAFVHEDKDQGHTLAKMDFNASTKTFSNLVDLATDSGAYIGWPAFTPDGKSVIYHAGSSAAFETDDGATGDVYIVDIATKTAHRLDTLDGYTASGTYLPAQDTGLNFAPTVLPEVVGGYFWTVFTSHRSYGSLLASRAGPIPDQDGKLWVAAIDLNAPAGTDPSHPAFYLDGQELSADNLRGFWVLPPCESNGAGCMSGDQCCSGFCRSSGGTSAPVCVTQPKGCSNEFEKCTTSSDCCVAGDSCINGRCATPPAPQ
jgi:hypothetical protein